MNTNTGGEGNKIPHHELKHCPNCVFPPNYSCDCSCHTTPATQSKSHTDGICQACRPTQESQEGVEESKSGWCDDCKISKISNGTLITLCDFHMKNGGMYTYFPGEQIAKAEERAMLRQRHYDEQLMRKADEEAYQRGREEERQFILNILDGVDIADKEMGATNTTKAIRFALQSRILSTPKEK